MDEYLFSSLLALLKLNQWGKKKRKKKFSHILLPLYFPFPGSSSHHPLAAEPWWTPSASVAGKATQPFTIPSSLFSCWFPPELLDREHCLVCTTVHCNSARKCTKRWASRKSSYKPTPDGETEAVSQTLWYTHRCHFPGLRIIMEIFTTFR